MSTYITSAWEDSGDAVGDYASTLSSNVPNITAQIGLITAAWEAQTKAIEANAEAVKSATEKSYQEFSNVGANGNSGNSNNTTDSKSKKLSETKYTVEEVNQIIADGGNYNIEDGKIYFLHVGQGYYLEDGSYYTFNGQRIREKDITIDELYRLIHYGDEKGNLYVPISVYETNDAMIIKRNQSYISYDKVAKGNSSLDRTNGVLLANVSKVRITCLDDDLLDAVK